MSKKNLIPFIFKLAASRQKFGRSCLHTSCVHEAYQKSEPLIIPEPTARSAVPGVSPGRELLIPHGYLLPGKCEHSEVQLRSAKFINDCGRITLAHRWTSLISNIWRTARSGKGKDPKKIYERTITQHEEKFFQPSLKGMIRFDLNMEHDEVHGKFVLTVCICSICIFAKKFPIAKRLCFSFHKRYD